MMTIKKQNALNRAGTALLCAARMQAEIALQPNYPKLGDAGYRALLARARFCLSQADVKDEPHKFVATKTALEALERAERKEDLIGGIEIFKSFVESVHGGQRDISFGGRQRQGLKPSASQAFLRAATVAFWEHFPKKRDQLVNQARELIDVGTKAKLESIVENFHQRHDVDIAKSRSPLSIHMSLVKDLIEHHGYKKLKDFA